MGMYGRKKKLTWLADSRSNVKSFPLYTAQLGERSAKAKPLNGLGKNAEKKSS